MLKRWRRGGPVTKRGMGLLLAAAGLFAVGDVTGTGWVQLADALLWAALVFSALVTATSGGRVEAALWWSDPPGLEHAPWRTGPTEGEPVLLSLRVRNPHPWPRFGLTLTYPLSINEAAAGEAVFHIPFLPPRAELVLEGPVQLTRRGAHRWTGGTAVSSAPFGLFRARTGVSGVASLVAHPVAWEPGAVRVPDAPGLVPQPVSARLSDEAAGSRPYAPGDPARVIHWRNSARLGHLVSRAYVATASPAPALVYGLPESGEHDAVGLLDQLVRVSAGLAWAWAATGVPLTAGPAGAPAPSWPAFSASLATVTPDALPSIGAQLDRLEHGAAAVAVVCAEDREGISALAASAGRLSGVQAWVLVDGDDELGALGHHATMRLRAAGVGVVTVERPVGNPGVLGAAA
jgi:uncharacterized protein (DUF58 family)